MRALTLTAGRKAFELKKKSMIRCLLTKNRLKTSFSFGRMGVGNLANNAIGKLVPESSDNSTSNDE